MRKTAYHGWNEAFIISNGTVEAVIVPEIGRVMQFRFAGDEDGPFWENRSLDGKNPQSQSSEWINFGGDKTWPAPQAGWEKMTGRGWPPPSGFDAMPVTAVVANHAIILASSVDPNYGIKTERRIELPANGASEMWIDTAYRKVNGDPVRVSVWVITQLKNPAKMFMPLPLPNVFSAGYNKQSDRLPEDLEVKNNIVTCIRATNYSSKIGSDASRLFWGDDKYILEISSRRGKRSEYPDGGSSAEIYTNPDPNQYVEFEFLGALATMKPGNTISRRQFYRLHHRDKTSLEEQLNALIARTPERAGR